MRLACLAALCLLAAGLPAADGGPAPSPQPTPTPTPETGFEYRLQFSQVGVFNGSPLGYTPIELGWRFGNGVRVRSGIDLFYYEGMDEDPQQASLGSERYSYEMFDWRTTLAWQWALPFAVRPVLGLSLDWLRGDRKRAVIGAAPRQDAWGFFGLGGALGFEWRLAPHWALSCMGRYTYGFNEKAPGLAAGDLGLLYLY